MHSAAPTPSHPWLAALAAMAFGLAATSARGQQPNAAAPPLRYDINAELAQPLRYVRFSVVQGMIEGFVPQSDRNTTLTANRNQRQERLAMVYVDGLPTIEYSQSAPELKLTLEMQEGRTLRIELTPTDAAQTAVLFTQDAETQLTLTLTTAGAVTSYRAPTLWRLWLTQPKVCGQYLAPLLGILRPDWDALPQLVERIEQALIRSSSARRSHDRGRWSQWATDLANPEFAVREAADRELRQSGQAVLPFLKSLDRKRLDAEQRFRIRLILDALSGNYEDDTPANVAAWLASDPAAWLAMLDRTDTSIRQTALEQLQQLLPDEAIEFDPLAEDAVRKEQLEQLRTQLGPRLAAGL